MTTRGISSAEAKNLAQWMIDAINSNGDEEVLSALREKVVILTKKFPIYESLTG